MINRHQGALVSTFSLVIFKSVTKFGYNIISPNLIELYHLLLHRTVRYIAKIFTGMGSVQVEKQRLGNI